MADVDPTFTLAPTDDPPVSADDDLAAAAAASIGLPKSQVPVADSASPPYGRSWIFDYEQGQFVRTGGSPADTSEFGSLEQWCLMAIHTARYAHPVFSDAFGMEEPDGVIGVVNVAEALADWQRHLADALLVHDRITDVQNFNLDWDPRAGILYVNGFDVITDEDEAIRIGPTTIQGGASA